MCMVAAQRMPWAPTISVGQGMLGQGSIPSSIPESRLDTSTHLNGSRYRYAGSAYVRTRSLCTELMSRCATRSLCACMACAPARLWRLGSMEAVSCMVAAVSCNGGSALPARTAAAAVCCLYGSSGLLLSPRQRLPRVAPSSALASHVLASLASHVLDLPRHCCLKAAAATTQNTRG